MSKAEKAIKKTAEKIRKATSEAVKEAEEIIGEAIEGVKDAVSGRKKEKTEKKTKKEKTKSPAEEVKEDKLAKLKEKAKKLAEKIESKGVAERKEDTLIPIEDYLKSSIHLGTRAITPDMKPYVYKRRADSLAVLNTELIDKKLREAGEYLSQFNPQDVIIVCKREAGEKAATLFSKLTGIRAFIKKYPAGILTNSILSDFIEVELVLVCDPWTDTSALDDARRVKIPVMAICDTNNYTAKVDKIIPGNNKSSKSLGMILYLLAKIYTEKRKIDVQIPPISEWIENWDNLVPPK